MINKLHIKNFKSIFDLEIDCARVNVFIGEPNTGKSNILEGIGIMSLPYTKTINDFVRCRTLYDLFYERDLNNNFNIKIEHTELKNVELKPIIIDSNIELNCESESNIKFLYRFNLESKDNISVSQVIKDIKPININPFKSYKFKNQNKFSLKLPGFLKPPFGENLLEIIKSNIKIDEFSNSLFLKYGYNLYLRTWDYEIEIFRAFKTVRSNLALPYSITSDTLQRIIFYNACIESNYKSTIVLEEPEVHVFPYYTEILAEKIAKNNSNQFFMATHNPYFIHTLMEKTPKEELGIFVTYYRDYQTHVYKLKNDEISEYMDSGTSIFVQIQDLTEELLDKGNKQ